MSLTVGSLFSGIGGFDLGLERAGMRVIWQSEIDPYASAVLRKHWPAVPNLGDIRGISAAPVGDPPVSRWNGRSSVGCVSTQEGQPMLTTGCPDILCGGFPCQDISNAGKRAGIDGERSGLWSEFARLIGELRPSYAIMENVAALLGRGMERVLGDLSEIGYDAEWHCIPASAVGAPHRRDRVWIVAYPGKDVADSHGCEQGWWDREEWPQDQRNTDPSRDGAEGVVVADTDQPRLPIGEMLRRVQNREGFADEGQDALLGDRFDWDEQAWFAVTGLGRVSHGIRNRVDRLRCLGNAIVPQIAEIIGRAIVSAER